MKEKRKRGVSQTIYRRQKSPKKIHNTEAIQMKKEILYIAILTLILVISGCGTEQTTVEESTEETTQEAIVEETVANEEGAQEQQTKETTAQETQQASVEETQEAETTTKETTSESTESTVKEFTITAVKFGYTPSTITVRKGDTVHIIIDNADGMHGMKIPELGISEDEEVTFVAEKAGTYTWYCNNFCGNGHKEMSGTLIVEE